MGQLLYLTIASLDGYIEDDTGGFEWARPSDEVHAFVNDLTRPIGSYLYGRRMYETMLVWETDSSHAAHSPVTADYAEIWQAADKVVYTTTLTTPATARTRIERSFEPDEVRHLKAAASTDVMIGGAELAAEAFRAGLVDECHLVLAPVIVGGGRPAFLGLRVDFDLLDHRRFDSGAVYLRYRVNY